MSLLGEQQQQQRGGVKYHLVTVSVTLCPGHQRSGTVKVS